uniref:Uncharacterized protein n=1 Tax=Tanacetum cinerariifolium TaxID=118510 RepID=A0A6L2MCS6_TANCI|nr:hypothetical protein [Tanacetum cinerariifolium]
MPIFKRTLSQDLDLLELHLTKDILSQTVCKTTLKNLKTKFENAFNSEFKERMHKYTRFDTQSFKDTLICTMDSIGKYMLEINLHQQRTPHLLKQKKLMQTQEDHSNPIRALNVDSLKVDLVVIQNPCSETEDSISKIASSKSVKESSLDSATKDISYKSNLTNMNSKKMDPLQPLGGKQPVSEVHRFIESSGTESEVQDDKSRSRNNTDADDADIRPIYDEEPMAMDNVFAIAALKNDLRKLKGNSVYTKFANTSVLGKPIVQPLRNQSVVRQPNAFKNDRPQMSKQRFASQVDGNHNLSKPVTQYYLPKKSESAFAKPDHMIASSSSRDSFKNMLRFSSNDMVHNHYLDEAKKKTQERDRNSKTSVMTPTRFQSTANDSKPKPRTTSHSYRSLPISKSSCVTIMAMPKGDHFKSPISFSDPTRFLCSTCNKCVFNANHDACITKLLKETSNVYEKISPRSDLRWKPTGRIFKSVGLRWLPIGRLFDSCTIKVKSEPPHGSNVDISIIDECKPTLDLSARTSINVLNEQSIDVSAEVLSINTIVMTSMIKLESLVDPLFDEYLDGENQVVSKPSTATTADTSDNGQQQPDSTSSTSSLATTVFADGKLRLVYIFILHLF